MLIILYGARKLIIFSLLELFVEIPKNPSVKFDKDTSAFWYKPHITREQGLQKGF